MILPVRSDFSITAVYRQTGPYWATYHRGIDFVSSNKNIYCTCNGTVRVVAYDEGGWGNYVSVGDSEGRRHIFCHLESVAVKAGDKVTTNTLLGVMGKTGNVTGVHLHYELHDPSDKDIDPSVYLGVKNSVGQYKIDDYRFADSSEISSWAKDYVKKVTEAGLMVGDANGKFSPKAFLTREQAAVIIAKLIERK